jgi:hypothetical protein
MLRISYSNGFKYKYYPMRELLEFQKNKVGQFKKPNGEQNGKDKESRKI